LAQEGGANHHLPGTNHGGAFGTTRIESHPARHDPETTLSLFPAVPLRRSHEMVGADPSLLLSDEDKIALTIRTKLSRSSANLWRKVDQVPSMNRGSRAPPDSITSQCIGSNRNASRCRRAGLNRSPEHNSQTEDKRSCVWFGLLMLLFDLISVSQSDSDLARSRYRDRASDVVGDAGFSRFGVGWDKPGIP